MCELSLPAARAEQLLIDFFKRCGKNRLHELVGDLADGLLPVPSVSFLGAAIPVRDDIAHITDENRVVREIEQVGLLGSLRRDIEFVEGPAQLLLDASSPGAEPGDHQCEQNKNDKQRAIRRFDVESVQGLC